MKLKICLGRCPSTVVYTVFNIIRAQAQVRGRTPGMSFFPPQPHCVSILISTQCFAPKLKGYLTLCIGNYMLFGYNCMRKWLGNCTRRNLVQFSHFRVQLHPKACNYLLIICFIKCSLIFQDSNNNSSYMRSRDMLVIV